MNIFPKWDLHSFSIIRTPAFKAIKRMVSQYQTIWTYSDSNSPNRFLGTFSLCSHCHINCLLFFHVFSSLAPVLQHVSSINFPSFCQALQWCRSRILSFWRHVATRVTTAVADHETQLVQDHANSSRITASAATKLSWPFELWLMAMTSLGKSVENVLPF